MKLYIKYAAIIISLAVLLGSCKKDAVVNKKTAVPVDVYVAGISVDTALYWKNGVPTYLTDGTQTAYANSIFVSNNNDVYVAGEEFVADSYTDDFMATSWKNGQLTILTNGKQTPEAYGNSVCVLGNDVYVGGFESENGSIVATYWKNGAPNIFGPASSAVFSVFASGNDIYLGGGTPSDQFNSYNATYWKNGSPVNLTTGNMVGNILSMFVSGGHVYAAGYADFTGVLYPAYWKDGTIFKLTNSLVNSTATSICVSGNDIYVAGYQMVNGMNVATYWKNNVPVNLSTENSNAISICISGSDVYVAGLENSYATYWKNGVATHIGNSGSIAYSIFVKPK